MTAWNTILKHSSSFWKIILLRSKHPSYITSSKQSCRACESHNCGDGKEHASCLKPSQIILGGSGGQCGSHMKPMSNEGVNSLVSANQKYHKNRDVVFMKNSTSIGNDLEMRPSGRNEGPKVVVVNKSSKSSLCNDGEEREEQMGNHLVANKKKTIKLPTNNDGRIEKFGKGENILRGSGTYLENVEELHSTPIRQKNDQCGIFGWFGVVWNVGIRRCRKMGGRKARGVDALHMTNDTWDLTNLRNDCKSVGCKWVFYTNVKLLDIKSG